MVSKFRIQITALMAIISDDFLKGIIYIKNIFFKALKDAFLKI